MTSAPPIGFEYHGSRLLMVGLIVMAVLAIAAVIMAELPQLLRGTLLAVVGAMFGASFARLLRPRVRTILWRADGGVHLELRDTMFDTRREVSANLHVTHVLGPLITLKLRWLQRGRATLWLLPDNLDADTRRRLRVRLRSAPPASH